MWTTLFLLLPVQDDPAALVEKLRSEDVEVRDDAARKLKALGAPALAALDRVSNDPDVEVAARATRLGRVIRTMQLLPSNLRGRMPGVEDRLAQGEAHEWTRVLLTAPEGLEKADLEALVVRAFQGARTLDEQKDLCGIVEARRLSVASAEVCRLFDVRDRTGERLSRRSPVGELHRRALDALRVLKDPGTLPRIAELLVQGEADLAADAARLLVDWKAKEILPRILAMIDEEQIDPALALSLLEGMDAREAVPQVLRLLKDDGAGAGAAELLAEWQARDSAPALIKLLQHREPRVRRRAMEVLADLRCPEAVPALHLHLRSEPVHRLGEVVEILGELKAKEAAPELLDLLKEREARLAAPALEALGRMGERKAIPIALEWLAAGSPTGLGYALQALADLQAVEAIPDLLKLLKDELPDRRATGLLGLSRVGGAETIPAIAALLADPEPAVRTCALRALADVDARALIPKIEGFLQDENREVRGAAVDSLRVLRAPGSTKALIRALSDPDVGVARSAAAVLADLGAAEAVPALLQLLVHADGRLRVRAAGALARLGSREGVPVLLQADAAKEYPDLGALNALRRPELWKKLQGRKLRRDLEGTNREVAEQLSLEAGLFLEMKRSIGFSKVSSERGRKSVLEAIEEWGSSGPILLESDRIHVGGGHLAFWREWWAEERKQK